MSSVSKSPRTFDAAALRLNSHVRLDEFAAELIEIDSWLPLETRHVLYELLDAELPERVYSVPPEWAHRVRLDCSRVAHWFRQDLDRPVVRSGQISPYWARIAELVARQLGVGF